ncbi:MAG TPA: putative inorganic carbon transporter subunit DabA, partial [Planctomycetaceae bacterium]|nr:putative inorganic carbon transporter subunit DabA [Planctomycetaceae bacterium]
MSPPIVSAPEAPAGERDLRIQQLGSLIEQAAALLPLPGPISAFAFLNTLQALEDLPFDVGMRRGARLYGCQPYLSEDRYREKMRRGRIRVDDLEAVLQQSLGDEG